MQEWMRDYIERQTRDENAGALAVFDALDRRILALEERLERAQRRHLRYFLLRKAQKLWLKLSRISRRRFVAEKAFFRRLQRRLPPGAPPARGRGRLFVDVSQTVHCRFMAGIPRVVSEIAAAALQRGGAPVFIHEGRLWTCALPSLKPRRIDPQPGDMLLLADQGWTRQADIRRVMGAVKAAGGDVVCVLPDLLPAQYPALFPRDFQPVFASWLERVILQCDAVVAISQTVARDFAAYACEDGRDLNSALKLGWRHLGADFDLSGLKASRKARRFAEGSAPFLLTVSTLDPRKGYSTALDALDMLWRDGFDVRYAIVGRYGWSCQALAQRIRAHPEFDRRLFWFDAASDGDLDLLMSRAHALVYPSLAEGFGLPIVESARYRLPVIASDIPVFREIGGEGLSYFAPGDDLDLARRMRETLAERRPAQIAVGSWRDYADGLIGMIDAGSYEVEGLPGLRALAGLPEVSVATSSPPPFPVTIVTVTRDSFFYTRLQVEKIREHIGARDYEIVVVDRGSRDGTLEWLRRQTDVRLIDYPQSLTFNHGHGEAAEMGVRAARFARVVLLDSDAFPVESDWLAQSVDRLDETHRLAGAAFVAPRAHHAHGFYAHPHFMAFFKSDLGGLIALRRLRGANEDTGEESTIRVLAAGKKIVALPTRFYPPLGVGRQDIPTMAGGVVHAWYASRLACQEPEVQRESAGAIGAASYGVPLQQKIRAHFDLDY